MINLIQNKAPNRKPCKIYVSFAPHQQRYLAINTASSLKFGNEQDEIRFSPTETLARQGIIPKSVVNDSIKLLQHTTVYGNLHVRALCSSRNGRLIPPNGTEAKKLDEKGVSPSGQHFHEVDVVINRVTGVCTIKPQSGTYPYHKAPPTTRTVFQIIELIKHPDTMGPNTNTRRTNSVPVNTGNPVEKLLAQLISRIPSENKTELTHQGVSVVTLTLDIGNTDAERKLKRSLQNPCLSRIRLIMRADGLGNCTLTQEENAGSDVRCQDVKITREGTLLPVLKRWVKRLQPTRQNEKRKPTLPALTGKALKVATVNTNARIALIKQVQLERNQSRSQRT